MPRGPDGPIPFGLRRSESACGYRHEIAENAKNYELLSTRKRTIAPSFERFKSRYREGQEMPAFMENLNNRTSITALCFEMLKANNYSENNMSSQISSCSPKKSFNRKNMSPCTSPSYKVYLPNGMRCSKLRIIGSPHFSDMSPAIRTPHIGQSTFFESSVKQ